MKTEKRLKKISRRSFLTLLLVTILAIVLIGLITARYFYNKESHNGVKAKEFYFTSNLLDEGTHTLAPGRTSISFELRNHVDALRYSETEISYSVRVDGVVPEGDNITGSLARGNISNCTVTVNGLTPGTHTITAEGDGGYHQSLSVTLIVPESEAALYKYLDTSNPDYVLLTVWAKGVSDTITITAPAPLIPDNTDDVMMDAKTGTAFTDDISFSSSGYGSHVYRFFGNGVTVDDINVVAAGGITAVEKAPN